MPAAAAAHNVNLPSVIVSLGTRVVANGRAWQPFGRIDWQYYRSTLDAKPTQTGSFRLNGTGRFTFRWRDEVVSLTHRLRFRQFDSRRGRTFRACSDFALLPTAASVSPPVGAPGDVFLVLAEGFPPGRAWPAR